MKPNRNIHSARGWRAPALVVALPIILAGCGLGRDDAKALGIAGTTAASAIESQAKGAIGFLGMLHEIDVVGATLECRHGPTAAAREACILNPPTELTPSVKDSLRRITDVAAKRARAAEELAKAYRAFTALAEYNAAAEVKSALTETFQSLDALATAASALTPGRPAIKVASQTFTATAVEIGGTLAGWQQSRLMRDASVDLRAATTALIQALTAEQAVAWNSLPRVLALHRGTLIKTSVSAGLIAPAIATSTASYQAAIDALMRLAEQHAKLERDQSLNIGAILNRPVAKVHTSDSGTAGLMA